MDKNENEIWKTYPEFDWIQGSNLGNVRTLDRYVMRKNERKQFVKGHVLKQYRMKDGYMNVMFKVNGKTVNLRAHRVIAMCFLSNPDSLPQVNHKNAVRDDNRVENLEWCDASYNRRYTEEYGEAQGRPIIAVNLKTSEALCFPSQHEAARRLGFGLSNVTHVIAGRQKTAHGYWFVRADSSAVEKTKTKFGDKVAHKVEQLMSEIGL